MGFFQISFFQGFLIALFLTHITIINVTVFLHRSQTHRALDLHPALSHFFRFWQWLTTSMSTKEWVAVHRKHHACVETEEDPHSPQILGLNRILWMGVMEYVKAATTQEVCDKYGHGTPDDWLERNVYMRFRMGGLVLMLLFDVAMFGVVGLMIWGIQMAWIPFFAAGVINGVGHYYGYRNYNSPDASRNIIPWGILIGGEELHNNHHAYPTSAKLSSKWYEFDLGYFYIRIFECLGLAKVLRKMPSIDLVNTMKTLEDRVAYIKKSRLILLARYKEMVCHPVATAYLPIIKLPDACSIKQFKSALHNFSNDTKSALGRTINDHDVLRQISSFSNMLDDLLSEKCKSANHTIKQLKLWCEKAKASNIKMLEIYSNWLESQCLQLESV